MNTPAESDSPPPLAWDPIQVRDLLRRAQSEGRRPAYLELGAREAMLFRAFLAKAYGDDGQFIFKDTYYLGLEVVQVESESHLAVSGNKDLTAGAGELRPLWADHGDRAA